MKRFCIFSLSLCVLTFITVFLTLKYTGSGLFVLAEGTLTVIVGTIGLKMFVEGKE